MKAAIGWARSLFADLIGHWEKRNLEALANYDPANIDQELLAELSRRYGGKVVEGRECVRGGEIVRVREGDPSSLWYKSRFRSRQTETAKISNSNGATPESTTR